MIEVLEAGPLSSVQTAAGRPDWRHAGVPVGGAADAWSARLANRLVGNEEDAPLLEITLGGARVRSDRPATMSVTGGTRAVVGGLEAPAASGFALRPGVELLLDFGSGARGYLAVAGGLVVEAVLGSAATDLRTGFGGHEGRALRAGDRLDVGSAHGGPARWTGTRDDGPIRIVRGPHGDPRELEGDRVIGVEADRTGMRLDGHRLSGGEVPSMGLPLGAVQVPPDGRPIIMLADRPVTGGYRVPGCAIGADIGRVAQLRTGDALTLASVSLEEAREALDRAEKELAAIEPLDGSGDELGWAGSHG
ncbi:MAG TPA: biotin-dependent carboxyltransferase family protein [Candidatus Limnocylindria bacterium]|nr:biotin-dependent carboxyltransferase family protein [Candidatus Limnocylindria bacterium]